MKNDNYLQFKNKNAFELLNKWSDKYLKNMDINVKIDFSPLLSIGTGFMERNINKGYYRIGIGISPLSISFLHEIR